MEGGRKHSKSKKIGCVSLALSISHLTGAGRPRLCSHSSLPGQGSGEDTRGFSGTCRSQDLQKYFWGWGAQHGAEPQVFFCMAWLQYWDAALRRAGSEICQRIMLDKVVFFRGHSEYFKNKKMRFLKSQPKRPIDLGASFCCLFSRVGFEWRKQKNANQKFLDEIEYFIPTIIANGDFIIFHRQYNCLNTYSAPTRGISTACWQPCFLFFSCVIVVWNHVLRRYTLQNPTGWPEIDVSESSRAQHRSDGFEANEIQCKMSALLEFYKTAVCPECPRLNVLCCLEMPSETLGSIC